MKHLFALVFLLPVLAVAQDISSSPPQPLPARVGNLSGDEAAKLAAVRQQVLQQHPDWVQQRTAYYNRMVTNQDAYTPDPSVQQGLVKLQLDIETAMKQLDPTVTPLLTKFHGTRWGSGFTGKTVAPVPSPTPSYNPASSSAGQSHPEQVDIPPGN